ncbi:hypothetical protein KIMH_09870 [Bombiscardovia apis]|uniref:DUF4190 domain-containing protein n=1 Tax=Bombiscardovia apis TaxID=2932182 RepID=A0ABM8BD80_9BIFI|nr:hypothetical protein [Bombiscardovia apis]BDR54876.1 hypothetical protein KIMH_09870 [Bombiscardovia apis]
MVIPTGSQQVNGQNQGQGYQPYAQPGNMQQPPFQQASNPGAANRGKHIINGIDLDDPQQNPAYGHWDPYAVLSLIMAICFPIPLISAFMGAIAIHRTRTFHMKGFGLAVAAVVINLLYSLMILWMAMSGISVDDLYQQMMQVMPNTGGTGGDQISA